MKKIYNIPSILVLNVKNEEILAGSPDLSADPSKTSSTMEARSRHYYYDDEDDFDFAE